MHSGAAVPAPERAIPFGLPANGTLFAVIKERLSLRARALQFLARRDHSRAELASRLRQHTDDAQELSTLLDDLERRGWLSEEHFVEQTIHRLAPKFGARRIAHTLREKGVSEESISAALPSLKDNELVAARKALRRKFPSFPTSKEEKARQMRFLQGRGFDYDVIRRVLEPEESDEAEKG
jgi:regulatory protein